MEVGDASDLRDALIEAMAASCATRGYAATSMEDLVAAVGCSRKDFTRHFNSVEECAMAAVETILSEGMAAVASGYEPDKSEWESAIAALKALLELFARRPALASLAFIDSRQAMPERAAERYRSGFAILTAMLDRLRGAEVESAQPPHSGARAAIGGGEALARREIAAGRCAGLAAALPDLVYSATVPFLGQQEALRLTRQARALVES